MDSIVQIGCIACRVMGHPGTPAVVHHLLRGGRRLGHMHTIPLCPDHHQQRSGSGKIARHPTKARFEAAYGTEQHLLLETQRLVKGRT